MLCGKTCIISPFHAISRIKPHSIPPAGPVLHPFFWGSQSGRSWGTPFSSAALHRVILCFHHFMTYRTFWVPLRGYCGYFQGSGWPKLLWRCFSACLRALGWIADHAESLSPLIVLWDLTILSPPNSTIAYNWSLKYTKSITALSDGTIENLGRPATNFFSTASFGFRAACVFWSTSCCF